MSLARESHHTTAENNTTRDKQKSGRDIEVAAASLIVWQDWMGCGRCFADMSDDRVNDSADIDVARVAHLARLYLTEEERQTFQGQLEQIVAYVNKINRLDLTGIEPTSHAHLVRNVFRRDEVNPGLAHDEVMHNAPASSRGQFAVPKIVE